LIVRRYRTYFTETERREGGYPPESTVGCEAHTIPWGTTQ